MSYDYYQLSVLMIRWRKRYNIQTFIEYFRYWWWYSILYIMAVIFILWYIIWYIVWQCHTDYDIIFKLLWSIGYDTMFHSLYDGLLIFIIWYYGIYFCLTMSYTTDSTLSMIMALVIGWHGRYNFQIFMEYLVIMVYILFYSLYRVGTLFLFLYYDIYIMRGGPCSTTPPSTTPDSLFLFFFLLKWF